MHTDVAALAQPDLIPDRTAGISRKRVTLTARNLYFASYQEAAQVVVAIVLGHTITHSQLGMMPPNPGWIIDLDRDFETVCGAGFAIESLLGRRHDAAWDHCRDDVKLMTRLRRDRDGVLQDVAASVESFMVGVTASREILSRPSVRAAVDELADVLSESYLAGEESVDGSTVTRLVNSLLQAT